MKKMSKRFSRVLGLVLVFAMMFSVGSVYAGDVDAQSRSNDGIALALTRNAAYVKKNSVTPVFSNTPGGTTMTSSTYTISKTYSMLAQSEWINISSAQHDALLARLAADGKYFVKWKVDCVLSIDASSPNSITYSTDDERSKTINVTSSTVPVSYYIKDGSNGIASGYLTYNYTGTSSFNCGVNFLK